MERLFDVKLQHKRGVSVRIDACEIELTEENRRNIAESQYKKNQGRKMKNGCDLRRKIAT